MHQRTQPKLILRFRSKSAFVLSTHCRHAQNNVVDGCVNHERIGHVRLQRSASDLVLNSAFPSVDIAKQNSVALQTRKRLPSTRSLLLKPSSATLVDTFQSVFSLDGSSEIAYSAPNKLCNLCLTRVSSAHFQLHTWVCYLRYRLAEELYKLRINAKQRRHMTKTICLNRVMSSLPALQSSLKCSNVQAIQLLPLIEAFQRGNELLLSKPLEIPRGPLRRSLKDIQISLRIAKGAYGEVFLVTERFSNRVYAMKVIHKMASNMEALRTECIILSTIQSELVVKLFYTFETRSCVHLVLEFVPGGDVRSLLSTFGTLSEDWIRCYCRDIANVLQHLQSAGVIHRDIKPENLLVGANGHLKLTDFGFAIFKSDVEGGKSVNRQLCSPEYVAPEIVSHGMWDWWSFGVCAYEFLYGKVPVSSQNVQDLFSKIVDQDINFNNELCTSKAVDIIRRLLIKDPRRRLKPCDCLAHPFMFADMNDQVPFTPRIESALDTSYFSLADVKSVSTAYRKPSRLMVQLRKLSNLLGRRKRECGGIGFTNLEELAIANM